MESLIHPMFRNGTDKLPPEQKEKPKYESVRTNYCESVLDKLNTIMGFFKTEMQRQRVKRLTSHFRFIVNLK